MNMFIKERFEAKAFEAFPRSLEEAREFFRLKCLSAEGIDEETLRSVVDKVARGDGFSKEEIIAMHSIVDLGDTCGCDSDHRMRGEASDGKTVGYATT